MEDRVELGDGITIGDRRFVPMISASHIRSAVDTVASAVDARYRGADPLLVCVLNGGALFHADLIRRLPFPLEADYIRVASYHGQLQSSGSVNFTSPPGTLPTGRNVILVEDIVDTGRTAARLREYYREHGAASVEVAALLYKREADITGHAPEYVGIEIPDRFVVGYGLDYRGYGRNLPAVYVLAE